MGCDSATFQDKGTEVPSLSRDKGKTGQAQNLTKERDGQGQSVKIQEGTWDRTQDGTIPIFFS
jgi:catalase